MIFGLLGHPDPSPKVLGLVAAGFVVFMLLARFGFFGGSSENGAEIHGTGRRFQCHRCGTYFQPEKEVALADGHTQRKVDDRCPHCGWDKDWEDRNHNGRPDRFE